MNHDPLCYVNIPNDIFAGPCTCTYVALIRKDERAAALRDAVEAVKLSCSADIELVERIEVIDAIEALGGE